MSVFKHTTWIPVGLVYQLPALRLRGFNVFFGWSNPVLSNQILVVWLVEPQLLLVFGCFCGSKPSFAWSNSQCLLVLNQSIAGHMTYPHHVPIRNIPVISGCALADASPQERCRLGYCPALSALFKLGQLGAQKIMRSSTNNIWNWWKIDSSGGKISLLVGRIPSVEGKISILENYLCGAKIQKHPNPSLDGEIKIYS